MLPATAYDEVADSTESPRDKERHRLELAALLLLLLRLYSEQVYAEIGLEQPVSEQPSESSWAVRRARDLLDQVNATTRRRIMAELTAVPQAEPIETTLERIRKVFDQAEEWRAPLTGQTTATEIGGFAAYNIATHTGLQRLIWSTMDDILVRGSHVVLDGQTLHPGELFTSGLGNTAYYPGAFGDPADDCNCRCWLEIEVGGKEAPMRRPELAEIRESIRRMAATAIAQHMVAIFRDQRASVIAAATRLNA